MESRIACPELVERGRLNLAQDAVLDVFVKTHQQTVILRAVDFLAFAQKRPLSLEKAVVGGEGVLAVPTTAFSLDNGPLPFNSPLLFVIPSS